MTHDTGTLRPQNRLSFSLSFFWGKLTFVYFIMHSLPLVYLSFILVWTSCLRGLWCYVSPSLDGWQKPYLVTPDLSMKNQQQGRNPNQTTDWSKQTEKTFQNSPLSPKQAQCTYTSLDIYTRGKILLRISEI